MFSHSPRMGRWTVATGGAERPHSGRTRNSWFATNQPCFAPYGAMGLVLPNNPSIPPPRWGGFIAGNHFHGFRLARLWRVSLHPWLHSSAPFGANSIAFHRKIQTTTSTQSTFSKYFFRRSSYPRGGRLCARERIALRISGGSFAIQGSSRFCRAVVAVS